MPGSIVKTRGAVECRVDSGAIAGGREVELQAPKLGEEDRREALRLGRGAASVCGEPAHDLHAATASEDARRFAARTASVSVSMS